jgi:hypothetical protein
LVAVFPRCDLLRQFICDYRFLPDGNVRWLWPMREGMKKWLAVLRFSVCFFLSRLVAASAALCLPAFALSGPCFIREIREIRGSVLSGCSGPRRGLPAAKTGLPRASQKGG